MNIKVTQCQVARFSIGSNESTVSFVMSIYQDGKIVELDGVKCVLHYEGKPDDIEYFYDAENDLASVFRKCVEYSQRIWSSIDYFSRCMAFAKVYQDNYEEITREYVATRNANIQRKIEELKAEMADECPLYHGLFEISNEFINGKIQRYKKLVDEAQQELAQIKEGTDKYSQVSKRITDNQKEIEKLTAKLIHESVENE